MTLSSREVFIPERGNIPIAERPSVPEFTPKIEKVETVENAEEMILAQPVMGEDGAVILDNPSPQQGVVIKLPLTDDQITQAMHLKVIYSVRWLAEWSKRVLKILGGKFLYRY